MIMILEQEVRDVQVCGNFEKRAFKIQAGAKAFEILSSNIYTHKVRAVIREVSCNAYDAHVSVGNTNPFDVHLPTYLESWFSVRDYGPGLSQEELETVYTTYFFSTKSNSNDYTGCLGLGSKSFFSICDSATVISYYNGVEYTYSCFKDENSEPQVALLTKIDTTEPNGLMVKVTVSTSQRFEFDKEAVNVFKYFKDLPNINIPDIVERINNSKKFLIETEQFSLTGKHGDLYAVMGNVAYEVPYEFNRNNLEGFIRFEIGELNFNPGREMLSLDTRTKENLQKKTGTINASIEELLWAQIDSEPTEFKKTLQYEKFCVGVFSKIINNSKKNFKQWALKTQKTRIRCYRKYRDKVSEELYSSLPIESSEYYLFKHGFTTRAREYCREKDIKVVMLTQEQIDDMKIDPEFIKDLASLPKIERAKGAPKDKDLDKVRLLDGSVLRHVEEIPDGTKLYVTVSRDILSGPFQNTYVLSKIIDSLSKYITVPEIYVVKNAYTNTVSFSKAGWISLRDYLNEEIKKINKVSILTYTGEFEYLLNEVYENNKKDFPVGSDLHEFNKKFKQYNKEQDRYLNLINFYKDAQPDNSLDLLEKKIITEYPMISLLSKYQDRSELKLIATYLTGPKALV